MALWQQFDDYSQSSNTICYAFIDKDGNQVGATQKARAQLSKSCAPIDIGGKVAWYTDTATGRKFYTLSTAFETVSTESENPPSLEEPASDDAGIDSTENLEEEKNKITEVEGI